MAKVRKNVYVHTARSKKIILETTYERMVIKRYSSLRTEEGVTPNFALKAREKPPSDPKPTL